MKPAVRTIMERELERVRARVSTARNVAASKGFAAPEVGVLAEAVDGLANLVEALLAEHEADG